MIKEGIQYKSKYIKRADSNIIAYYNRNLVRKIMCDVIERIMWLLTVVPSTWVQNSDLVHRKLIMLHSPQVVYILHILPMPA